MAIFGHTELIERSFHVIYLPRVKLIENTIANFLNKIHKKHDNSNESNEVINLFFQNQMSSVYKLEEKQIRDIVTKHIKPNSDNSIVKLIIYYRNKKLSSLFIRNSPKSLNLDTKTRHHVVYQYTCDLPGCNPVNKYIGYTACSIWERFKMHTQIGSIKKHLKEAHSITKIDRQKLIDKTQILLSVNDKKKLVMSEAILIKSNNPSLNAQEEGADRLLKIFKH